MVERTAFILVPGLHTGGWIWDGVAEGLRGAGAEAYALTLSGLDGQGGGADLAAHTADVLRAVRATDAGEVVLVGHCYGVHPVVAAADRLPERVTRVVLVDTPMPQDGDPPAALVPEQGLRAELLRRIAGEGARPGQESAPLNGADEGAESGAPREAGAAGGEGAGPGEDLAPPFGPPAGADLAPPTKEGWGRFGALADLEPAAVDLLVRRAVPHPWGSLAEPLRLTGAAGATGKVPVTGVLCAANGASLGMVERALALGDPRLSYLGAPHMSYAEMPTGHWPMLADPAGMADVLLRAAAGEGLTPRTPSATELPSHLGPFLLDVPECPRERTGRVDLHLPGPGAEYAPLGNPGAPLPAVVFVHGGPVPEGARPTPRDWPALVGYARLAAQLGVFGAVVDHRLHGLTDFGQAAGDVQDAVALVRADPRVDADRVAVWFLSVGGLLSADWLAAPPPWLRCVALSYPLLAPLPGWGVESRFRPATAVRTAGELPVVLTRVGRERSEFAATVAEFLGEAAGAGVPVEVVDIPSAPHGFETQMRSGEAGEAVIRAARAVVAHLRTPAAG